MKVTSTCRACGFVAVTTTETAALEAVAAHMTAVHPDILKRPGVHNIADIVHA